MATRKRTGDQDEQLHAAKVVNAVIGTIGTMTDQLVAIRDKKKVLAEQVDLLDAEYKQVEEALIERLKAEGSTKGSGKLATCSITMATVPTVTDWDKVYAYIKKTGFWHLLQRRMSDAAWRELFEKAGKPLPGTEPFSKEKLNVRAL